MNTLLWIAFAAAGVFALVVVVASVRRGLRRGRQINRELLDMDASARAVRRAERRQKGVK